MSKCSINASATASATTGHILQAVLQIYAPSAVGPNDLQLPKHDTCSSPQKNLFVDIILNLKEEPPLSHGQGHSCCSCQRQRPGRRSCTGCPPREPTQTTGGNIFNIPYTSRCTSSSGMTGPSWPPTPVPPSKQRYDWRPRDISPIGFDMKKHIS